MTTSHDLEHRLDELRSEALRHRVVSGAGVAPAGSPFPQATPENGYYGLPLLKRPTWTWEVPLYFFVGGAAGASALIALAARRSRSRARRDLARDALWIAAGGGALSGVLLTMDLGRPARFLNMLRVFKAQSPMSVGAWTLTAFSSAAAAAAFADAVEESTEGRMPVRIVGDVATGLAAAAGLGMATYTGVLIGATAVPVWNTHVRLLPMHFAASALASSASLLELIGHEEPALNRLALAAAAIELAAGAAIELDGSRASEPLKKGTSGWITRTGCLLSGPLPMLLRVAGGAGGERLRPERGGGADRGGAAAPSERAWGWGPTHSRKRRVVAILTLAGALLTRFGWWAAGSRSADDPRVPLALDAGPERPAPRT